MLNILFTAVTSSIMTAIFLKYINRPISTSAKRQFIDKKQEYKLVLLIRTDLPMTKGKVAAQCCHATLAAYQEMQKTDKDTLNWWESTGQAKVTLKVNSEEELVSLMQKAKQAGICAKSIKDAGRTQILPGSKTVCAIGPGPKNVIDLITGHLKLY